MLSPWSLKIVRSDTMPLGLVAVFAASITPKDKVDQVLEEITPMRTIRGTPV
jgi:hypothetical protein